MKLVIADSAWDSLADLQAYWAQFNSDDKVEARIDELLSELLWLSEWPGAGAVEVLLEHRGRQYRRWVVGKVKVVYYIKGDELRVSDFFDARQHPRRMKG
ncbi:MAG: hypothetical protein IPK70_10505 [Flavobacteriales bacterium]|nr:hypothetical protein [Flavobacteriales bacterium]